MKVLIATGGTGGHIFVGRAIADELEKCGCKIIFTGTSSNMENTIMRGYREKIYFLSGKGAMGRPIRDILPLPFILLVSLLQSIFIVVKENPEAVLGTGSYSSFSPVLAAALLGKPVFLTEIDITPGITTRLLAPLARRVFTGFPMLEVRNTEVFGIPLRAMKRMERRLAKLQLGFNPERPLVFIFGGSRGAHSINLAAKEGIEKLTPKIQFLIATGKADSIPMKERFAGNSSVVVRDFVDNMGIAYSGSDLIVSRAGALTIAEILNFGRASILIPYPYARGKHQLRNAEAIKRMGACRVLLDENLSGEAIAKEISNIIWNNDLRISMEKLARTYARRNSAAKIAEEIMKMTKPDT
jgi:UDP-N-acetylglucosamine--N-acetylmuramyl-(pentapeptide) pyrophosphoryl-undecaprenol N-acetylglucosamine transferase